MERKPFLGIPAGRVAVTPVPNVIFSELVPAFDDLAEAQVTLHIFYLLSHKKGNPRYVTLSELQSDTTLMRGLDFKVQNLKRGLEQATARGALIRLVSDQDEFYFFNSAESRRAVERIERGELTLGQPLHRVDATPQAPPNIFKLYEQNIGALTPLIAEELQLVEREYPPEVIAEAFRLAVVNNKRAWAYVRRILANWAREGRFTHGAHDESSGRNSARERKPYIRGKLANGVKRTRR